MLEPYACNAITYLGMDLIAVLLSCHVCYIYG
jgi:hypothetical protein